MQTSTNADSGKDASKQLRARISPLLIGLFLLIGLTGVIGLFLQKKTAQDNEVTIGVILPLTGEAAQVGRLCKVGIEMAAADLATQPNARKLRFVIEDGAANPKTSLNALQKLRSADHCSIIFSIISSVDLAILEEQKRHSFFFLSHATHPALSQAGALVFRHSPTVQQEAEILDREMTHIGKTALLVQSDDYGKALSDLLGNKVRINVSFAPGTVEFAPLAAKAIQDDPDSVIVAGTGRNLGLLILKLRELGYKKHIIATLGLNISGALNQVPKDPALHFIDFDTPIFIGAFKERAEAYQRANGKPLSMPSLTFYNSALLLSTAIQKAKYVPQDLTLEILALKDFKGFGEKLTVLNSHDITPKLRLTSK